MSKRLWDVEITAAIPSEGVMVKIYFPTHGFAATCSPLVGKEATVGKHQPTVASLLVGK